MAIATASACRSAVPHAPPEIALPLDADSRLLVLAPHPDDESLGAAGLIQRVKAAGGSVHVIVMTSGDAFPEGVAVATHKRDPQAIDYRRYAETRERETLSALEKLGLSRADLRFLGFPDGGLCLIASKYLSAKSRAFESPYTGRRQPPASEHVIRGVAYRGEDVRRELERILLAYHPTIVVMPAADDDHPDHCATSIFAREAVDGTRSSDARVLQYLVHHEGWPESSAAEGSPLEPPAKFPTDAGQWRTLRLTPEEAALKQRVLIDAYPTQMLVLGKFLTAFARPNELFLDGRGSATPECWCDESHVATETPPERYRRRPRARR